MAATVYQWLSCVCVCYVYTHTHTHTPATVIHQNQQIIVRFVVFWQCSKWVKQFSVKFVTEW